MKIIITESQYKLIQEQNVSSNISSIYNQIINAVKDLGTDPDKLINALNNLKSQQDFYQLTRMFVDKKTGYGSFNEMINGEFEINNYDDAKNISNKLNQIGVNSTFNIGRNNLGQNLFNKGFKISYNKKISNYPRVGPTCKSRWSKYLTPSKKYWIDWLSNPITKSKFKNNWKINDYEVNNIFKEYINTINKLTLVFYDKYNAKDSRSRNAYAFVSPDSDNTKIHINCSLNDKTPYETLIHEIQHILYNIKPLNPEKQVGDVFVNSNTKKMTFQDFFDILKNPTLKKITPINQNIEDASKNYNIRTDVLTNLLLSSKNSEKRKPGYACRETEKMSNIMAVRKFFNIKPGENITKEMLKPYISGEKNQTDIFWILSCWALNGFGDINLMLNKMNQLAFQNTKNNDGTVNV
jgi:hypothetical protein